MYKNSEQITVNIENIYNYIDMLKLQVELSALHEENNLLSQLKTFQESYEKEIINEKEWNGLIDETFKTSDETYDIKELIEIENPDDYKKQAELIYKVQETYENIKTNTEQFLQNTSELFEINNQELNAEEREKLKLEVQKLRESISKSMDELKESGASQSVINEFEKKFSTYIDVPDNIYKETVSYDLNQLELDNVIKNDDKLEDPNSKIAELVGNIIDKIALAIMDPEEKKRYYKQEITKELMLIGESALTESEQYIAEFKLEKTRDKFDKKIQRKEKRGKDTNPRFETEKAEAIKTLEEIDSLKDLYLETIEIITKDENEFEGGLEGKLNALLEMGERVDQAQKDIIETSGRKTANIVKDVFENDIFSKPINDIREQQAKLAQEEEKLKEKPMKEKIFRE